MVTWTRQREARALVAHVARCRFCAALLSDGASRRDRQLLEAAEALLLEHGTDEDCDGGPASVLQLRRQAFENH